MPGEEGDAFCIGVIGFFVGIAFKPGVGDIFPLEGPLQCVGLPGVAVNYRDVVERFAVLVPFADAAGDVVDFIFEGVELAECRWGPTGAGYFRGDQGDMVVVGVLGLQEVFGEIVGEAKDFPRIAVVEPEDGGASTGFNARAGQRESQALLFVDGLRIVVEQQQGVGVRVDHLHDELEPFLLEVVAFVDHHRTVLGAGYLVFLYGLDDGFYFPLPIGCVTFNHVYVISFTLQAAPFVEVVHLYFLFDALFGDEAAQPGGQGDVEAQH